MIIVDKDLNAEVNDLHLSILCSASLAIANAIADKFTEKFAQNLYELKVDSIEQRGIVGHDGQFHDLRGVKVLGSTDILYSNESEGVWEDVITYWEAHEHRYVAYSHYLLLSDGTIVRPNKIFPDLTPGNAIDRDRLDALAK